MQSAEGQGVSVFCHAVHSSSVTKREKSNSTESPVVPLGVMLAHP